MDYLITGYVSKFKLNKSHVILNDLALLRDRLKKRIRPVQIAVDMEHLQNYALDAFLEKRSESSDTFEHYLVGDDGATVVNTYQGGQIRKIDKYQGLSHQSTEFIHQGKLF